MIRINLLPQARKAPGLSMGIGPASNQTWALIYLAAVFIWMIGLGVVYFVYQGRLEEQQRANNELNVQIEQMRSRSARLEQVKAELDRSRQLEQVVDELQKARTGPLRIVMELSHILSQGGGPTIDPQRFEELRRDNPLAVFNPSWDVRRLSLDTFNESNREVRISGKGRTNEDVAEFIRRLSLSELFTDVALTRTEATQDRDTGLTLIKFDMTAKVTY